MYALTDFRVVVRRSDRTAREVVIDDIVRIELCRSLGQRLFGTRTLRIHTRRAHTLAIANLGRSAHLALVLELLAVDRLAGTLDEAILRNAVAKARPARVRVGPASAAAAALVSLAALIILGLARFETLAPVVYAIDDPIAPAGHRRSRAEIMAFMEGEVMPFARRVLGPLKGGPDQVTCETCHGRDASARNWTMPGVRALPEPRVRLAGMERLGFLIDPQIRNAVYGYLAREENQSIAGYMRAVVMPGMAGLLHRPPYDFTKSFGYNRARAAVGCYHCHLVEQS